jgi:hypothetical protein
MELTNDFKKAFRVSLKLKEGASPHIYTIQLKEIMKDDTELHPMMHRTLKLLKKTRMPFIKLAMLREVIFDAQNFRHFDRSADPPGKWVCTLWSIDEIRDFKSNPEEYIKTVLKFFQKLGYDLYDSQVCSADYMKTLEELTQKQIEAQMTNINYEELLEDDD